MRNQRTGIEWRDGQVPVSTRFDDPYFSLENGLDETRYVFLKGNELPARFQDGFHVAELGFGTGLNFLATCQSWVESGTSGMLHYTSFEAFPLSAQDMRRALKLFPELAVAASVLTADWDETGGRRFFPGNVSLNLIIGDAHETLPKWTDKADAWFLDGFSPAKNPELWEDTILTEVAEHTASGGTAATYTAAGFVRRGLEAAGFSVARAPGFGRKRHMTKAVLTT